MPAPSNRPDNTYAITRIDLPGAGTHGWQVRMQRRGIKYSKFFADRLHNGPKKSRVAARQWRDALIEKVASRARVCARSPRNSSGVVGVSKTTVIRANGTTYQFWQADWTSAHGERCCMKFSIKQHGNSIAFQLAVEARTEGVSE